MPNVMGVLRAEIRRLARKEAKEAVRELKRQVTALRRRMAMAVEVMPVEGDQHRRVLGRDQAGAHQRRHLGHRVAPVRTGLAQGLLDRGRQGLAEHGGVEVGIHRIGSAEAVSAA